MFWLIGLLFVGGVVAATSLSSSSSSKSSPATPIATNAGPMGTQILNRWHAYADALRHTPAPGIVSYAAAIDATRATMKDYLDGRAADRDRFTSAVSALFTPAIGGWARDVINFINKLGTPGGDGWDPAHLDQAESCAKSTLAEGWPLVAYSIDHLVHFPYLGVQQVYCETQEAMRALPAARGAALKLLWRQIALHSADPTIAFLTRFSLRALVQDGYSDAANQAQHAFPFLKNEPMDVAPWAVMTAIVAAISKGMAFDALIPSVIAQMLATVADVDPATGYQRDKLTGSSMYDVTAFWNMLGEVTRIAFSKAGWALH